MKAKDAFIRGTAIMLAIYVSGPFADSGGKDYWELGKDQMEYEREQRKRDREWEREERKYYKKLERKERKHLEKLTRKERKNRDEMWREGDYRIEPSGYEYGVDTSYPPEFAEDKLYRIIQDVRDLTNL